MSKEGLEEFQSPELLLEWILDLWDSTTLSDTEKADILLKEIQLYIPVKF
jgi:hypothetical protein